MKVLNACINDFTIVDLMNVTKRSNRTKFRNDVLAPLLSKELVEMTIPDKRSSSKQKYRLTAKGKDFLAKDGQEDVK